MLLCRHWIFVAFGHYDFIVNILKTSSPSQVNTQDLLITVESTGKQQHYQSKVNLRHQACTSLQVFLQRCQQRFQRHPRDIEQDPFGDLFMGFECKRKPVLQSIMNHHGLVVDGQRRQSTEEMRHVIISHIALGHCTCSLAAPQAWSPEVDEEDMHASCADFIQDGDLHIDDNEGNQSKIINKVLEKHPSQKFLLQFLNCQNILHDPSQSSKRLRITLARFACVLEKWRSGERLHNPEFIWPRVVPQTLKDKIGTNFRHELSRDNLQSLICCSCSTMVYIQDSVTVLRSEADLFCLQHPEIRLSGMTPDLHHIPNANLEQHSLENGILLDKRKWWCLPFFNKRRALLT